MARPWEAYQQHAAAPQAQAPAQAGPWTQYAQPITDLPKVYATIAPEDDPRGFIPPREVPSDGQTLLNVVRQYYPDWDDKRAAREVAAYYEKQGIPKAQFYSTSGLDKSILGFDSMPKNDPTEGMSFGQRFAAGAGSALHSAGQGVKQLGTAIAREALGDRTGLTQGIAQGPLTASLASQQANIDETRRLNAPLMGTGAGMAGNIAGNIALAAIPGSPIARTAGVANRVARFSEAAARGGALGAIQPVGTGESRGQNIAVGAGAGLAGQGVTSSLGRLARGASEAIDPVKRASLDTLAREGVPVHFSQVSSSIPTKTAASITKYIPFSGAGKASQNQQEAWNRAISRSFGVESPQLTDDVIAQAKQQFNVGYDDVFSRNNVTLRPADLSRMQATVREATKDLTGDEAKIVKNQFDRILDDAGTGTMSGSKYQSLRSTLAGIKPNTDVGAHVTKLRRELESAAERSLGPQDAAALKALNKQYNNMKVAENLLKQVAGAGGDIKPSSLWAQVNKRGPKATQQMRDLARAGQTVLKDPIPDSGTPGRLIMGGLLAGGGAPFGGPVGALGALAAGIPAARFLNSPTFGNYLANGGGNTLQRLASGSRALPYLATAAATGTQFGQEYLPPEPVR